MTLKVTFAAVALSVAALIVVNGLSAGVSDAMIANAVSIQAGHVLAGWNPDFPPQADILAQARAIPSVRSALMRSRRTGVVRSETGSIGYAAVYGVDPASESRETVIAARIIQGRYLQSPGEIVIGARAAEELHAETGETVEFRDKRNGRHTYRLVGVFSTGLGEMDHVIAFTVLDDAPCDSREISLFLDSPHDTPSAAARLAELMPEWGWTVDTWRETMPNTVQVVTLNRASAKVVLILVLGVLAFGIFNTIYVSVSERTRELGILRTLGLIPREVALTILLEALLLVAVASLVGTLIGWGATAAWSQAGGLDLDAWGEMGRIFVKSGRVVPRLTWGGLLLPPLVAVGFGLLAAFIPARRAGRVDVVEAMRQL
ncbi:MAG: FtsX-like permease family protein [Planctomycetes bacterium]|jgi:ABC-type lipoprotein release transport system permease subunit|nr:ABC transporter permease [Phycisphaerae bacterium]NBB96411.1 FtsX-like permease family protein [Planctomycetota bacterium]